MSKETKVKSSLRLKSKTPLEKDEVHKIDTIIMHLYNHNESFEFRQPVDWRALELFDYLEIIKNPMDLGTINNKFKDKRYRTVEAVLNDIQLIWDNCKIYNTKCSEIYEIADKLELGFRKMVRNYLPHLKISTVTSIPVRPFTEPPFTVVFKPKRPNQNRPIVSLKRQFVDKIGYLSQDNLERILNMIKQFTPQSFVENKEGWARIQLENIQNATFLKIFNLMSTLLQDIEV